MGGVVLAAGSIGVGIGMTHLQVLASSQLVTTLPEWFSRSVLSASVAVLIPGALIGWRGYSAEVTAPIPVGTQRAAAQRSSKKQGRKAPGKIRRKP